MPEPSGPPATVGRRRVLATAALGLAGTLTTAACGIRLDSNAPDLPFLPRTPIPGEQALVALTADCATLAGRAREAGATALLTDLATLHARQHEVLVTALRAKGVPEDVITPPTPEATGSAASTPPSPTPTPSPNPSPARETLAALAGAEAAALSQRSALAAADADLRPTACAVLAQRYAAATLLGGTVPEPPGEGTAAAAVWLVPGDAVPLLTATRSAAYGFEVVAARSTSTDRVLARAGMATLTMLVAQQEASLGAAAPEPPLGYVLPFPVSSTAAARRLAAEVTGRLRTAYGATLAPLTRSAPTPTFDHLPWWLGRAEVLAHRWGEDLQPFPGLG